MNAYRLDRRFVLQGIGLTLLASAAAFVVGASVGPTWLALVGWLAGFALLIRAALLWARPPVVARTDDEGITLGGRFTVKPVSISWRGVEQVSHEDGRLLIDRGDDTVVVFPLAFVGDRAGALVREFYDRLNTAHGYQRFDPSA